MRIPLSWLREFVAVSITAEELAERMTLAGLEISAVERIGDWWDRDHILVGRVTAVAPHPNADRLKLVDIDYGAGRSIRVVTGAPNLAVGQGPCTIALALAGAELWDTHQDPPVKAVLKPAKLRGIESAGMVCSERELGISEEHGGIIILPDDAPVGTALADFLGETVLTLELTPNLSRCLSIAGVAREVAALTGAPFTLPPASVPFADRPASEEVEIAIEEPGLCSRYCGMVIEGVDPTAPSPFRLAWRLKLLGQRPLGAVVDITNYVMFERGQPLHAFDLATIGRGETGRRRIIVRRARPGERLTTLDGAERILEADDLVIADPGRAVALAGVMGGLETEIGPGTRAILLEAATFDPVSVYRTSRRLRLPSQASLRFGKGLWPALAEEGALRSAELFAAHAGGAVLNGIVEDYPRPPQRTVITLPAGEIGKVLGIDLPAARIAASLTSLGFTLEEREGGLDVTVPAWRLDCTIPADLVEEVARLHGYGNLPDRLLPAQLPRWRESGMPFRRRARDLGVRLGFWEIITYAMIAPEEAALLGYEPDDRRLARLVNPLSSERSVLRPTLLVTMLQTMAANFRFRDRLAHLEAGAVFSRDGERCIHEEIRLCLGLGGPRRPSWWGWEDAGMAGFFDLKGRIEALLVGLGVGEVSMTPATHPLLAPGMALEIWVGGVPAGFIGEVSGPVAKHFDLPEIPVAIAELSLPVLAGAGAPPKFSAILRFPPATIDIALVIPDAVPAARVADAIRTAAGELLRDATPFDLYRGPQVPDGHRSLAWRLTFQSPSGSLTEKETGAARERILRALAPLSVTLRG